MTATEPVAADVTSTVDVHLAAYCEPDLVRRRKLLDRAWTADGVLIDPPFSASGTGEIAALVDAVLGHYPGHRFRRITAVDVHHGVARYGWVLEAPGGAVAVAGTDIADVAVDGRLARVVGFFGDPPPA